MASDPQEKPRQEEQEKPEPEVLEHHDDLPKTMDVDEASEESFPASDPPAYTPSKAS